MNKLLYLEYCAGDVAISVKFVYLMEWYNMVYGPFGWKSEQ